MNEPSFHRDLGLEGPISIEFVRTDDMWQHFAGVSDTKLASGLKFHSAGETTDTSASATGNVIAWGVPTSATPPPLFVSATVGQHQQVQVNIVH